LKIKITRSIFTAHCYATAVYAAALCLSILPKWLYVGLHKQGHTVVQGLYFSDAKSFVSSVWQMTVASLSHWTFVYIRVGVMHQKVSS